MRKRILFLPVLLLISLTGMAQDGPATWYELELSKKIIPDLTVELKPELRLAPGFEMDKYILECGVEYELHKALEVAAYYRYYKEEKKKEDEIGHRYAFDLKSGFDWNQFEFQVRLRYQDYFNSGEVEENPTFRYKAKLEYEVKKLDLTPYLAYELFHDLDQNELNKTRYDAGVKYELNKRNDLSLYYRAQDSKAKDDLLHIIGFSYSLKL